MTDIDLPQCCRQCGKADCEFMVWIEIDGATLCTRSRPAPQPDALDVLDLLKKKVAWGKEIDRNHLFEYHNIGQMIDEAEQRVAQLRQQHGGEQR